MVTYLNCMALALGISAGLSSAPRLGTPFTNTKSLSFDGTDDKVTPAVQLGSSFAISIWIKQNDQNTRYILDARDASNTSAISVQSQSEGAGIKLVSNAFNASSEVSINAWHHVAITYDSSSTTGKLYVDGVLDNTKSISLGSSAAALTVGARYSNQSFWSDGLDELATWNTVLDADAVSAIYNSGEPTDLTKNISNYSASSNLQAWYRMGDATVPAADGTSNFIFDQVDTSLGSELIANGSFDGVADGTDPVGNVSNYFAYGSPTTRQITGGQLQLTTDGSNEGVRLNVPSLTAGVAYQIQMDISGDGSDIGAAVYISGGGNNQVPARTNGKIDTIFAPATANIYLYLRAGDNTAGTTFYDNISVKQLNGKTATISGATIQTDTP